MEGTIVFAVVAFVVMVGGAVIRANAEAKAHRLRNEIEEIERTRKQYEDEQRS